MSAPGKVETAQGLVDTAQEAVERGSRVLLGFDFPIGLPAEYARKANFEDFLQALAAVGTQPWGEFFEVCDSPSEISLRRPFYPKSSRAGAKRQSLVDGLQVANFADLLRSCERATSGHPDACSLFWTLGGNQVGRAAIAGWQEILRPALRRGARMWPFSGSLEQLSQTGRLVICETYPREAYGHVGVSFGPGMSKRRKTDRAAAVPVIEAWAIRHQIEFSPEAIEVMAKGFGERRTGEDAFDAFMGVLGMIEVSDRRRAASPALDAAVAKWEGWILGQA